MLRPTVAIGRFIIFCALALHEYPEEKQKLIDGSDERHQWFVQEVRRYYPFFPAAVARVKEDFEWQGYPFPKGTRVLLDLYGTNHDSRLWEHPEQFQAERFRHWNKGEFNFIPQGGGGYMNGHRCAGEWITIELMKAALKALTQAMTYTVPEQDLSIDLSQMPALPRSRFIINHVAAINNTGS